MAPGCGESAVIESPIVIADGDESNAKEGSESSPCMGPDTSRSDEAPVRDPTIVDCTFCPKKYWIKDARDKHMHVCMAAWGTPLPLIGNPEFAGDIVGKFHFFVSQLRMTEIHTLEQFITKMGAMSTQQLMRANRRGQFQSFGWSKKRKTMIGCAGEPDLQAEVNTFAKYVVSCELADFAREKIENELCEDFATTRYSKLPVKNDVDITTGNPVLYVAEQFDTVAKSHYIKRGHSKHSPPPAVAAELGVPSCRENCPKCMEAPKFCVGCDGCCLTKAERASTHNFDYIIILLYYYIIILLSSYIIMFLLCYYMALLLYHDMIMIS